MTDHQRQVPTKPAQFFDYFGDLAAGAKIEDVSTDGRDEPVVRRPRQYWRALFKLLFIGCCGWFAWQYHDLAQYSFSAARAPLQLGDVTTFTPDLVPHNAFVCVDGISEHRGMSQKVSRLLGESAQSYWYFRLLGSRGIFVEVPPEAEHYGTTQKLHVCGRAVDPARSPTFHKLIAAYETLFATEVARPTRVVEGGMQPSEHRLRYSLVIGALAAALGLQLWALYRNWR